ncbi:MAG: NUDIX domain-containing protein [Bacteroidota bacterium]
MPQPHILLAVDAVVLGYNPGRECSVLLIRRKYPPFQGQWALPGGFVEEGESIEVAVERELAEETGVHIHYLEQLFTFGNPDRDPRRRVVSIAYFALVKPSAFQVQAASDASEAAWFSIKHLPPLAFDHADILDKGLERVRNKITYEPIGFELLEEKFTFVELQHLYETLLDRKIDRRNFQKKLLSLGILEELEEHRKHQGSGRPAKLYRFNPEQYAREKEKVIMYEIWNMKDKEEQ